MSAESKGWYSRPVFLVTDVERSLAHYTDRLGFAEQWRYDEDGLLVATQVQRDGLEIILNRDVERAGGGRLFMSLDRGQTRQIVEGFRAVGVQVEEGHRGMPIMYVTDDDGNELFFYDDVLDKADAAEALEA